MTIEHRLFNQVVIVEDDENLCRTLVSSASPYAREVFFCHSLNKAKDLLPTLSPELVMLDFQLGDGSAIDLWDTISQCSPYPKIIVMSAYATDEQVFSVAQLGAISFLKKPFTLTTFQEALEQVASFSPPDYLPFIRLAVGHKNLKDVENDIRGSMIKEAVNTVGGSKRGAAKILSVSRQLIQHAINKYKNDK